MEDQQLDVTKLIEFWTDSAGSDYLTMINLFNSKDYHWSLFMGHLVIEKLLKALYVKAKNSHAPLTHDLKRIAQIIPLELTDEYSDWLDIISSFNINARYDSIKRDFYKRCTPEYSAEWIERIKLLKEWIKKEL
ncbi:MAG: hypothetical protein FMNOHCHN_02034 [Ignavibacteriaceae bacterium]|nr:hypothetical protein [Ignavibacteriaceae bacterium]